MQQEPPSLHMLRLLQRRWARVHLLARQDRHAVVRVLLAPVDGMHQRGGAVVHCRDQLALLVSVLDQAPQLWIKGPIPCNAMPPCTLTWAANQDHCATFDRHSTGASQSALVWKECALLHGLPGKAHWFQLEVLI